MIVVINFKDNKNTKLSEKKDRQFIQVIKNTYQDFKSMNNKEMIETLQKVLKEKELCMGSISLLIELIESRKMDLDLIKKIQDSETFKTINQEHKVIEQKLKNLCSWEINKQTLITKGGQL